MTVKLLKTRIRRLRLDKKSIALAARLDETTVGRALNGRTDPRNSTLSAIEAVVAIEERELLSYLKEHAA